MRNLLALAGLLLASSPAFAVVEVPVPEPASLGLLAVGAGALLIARLRK